MSSNSSSSIEDEDSDSDCSSQISSRRSFGGQQDQDEEKSNKVYHVHDDESENGSDSSDGEGEGTNSEEEKSADRLEPQSKSNSEQSKAPAQKPKKTARITINLDHCDYDIFTDVCSEMGWRISSSRTRWNIKWMDRYLLGITIKEMRLRPGQRINHFPAVCELAFKCKLANNLNRVRRLLPEEYSFHPDSWVLPDEMLAFTRVTTEHRNRTYIVKPNGGSQVRPAIIHAHARSSSSSSSSSANSNKYEE